MQKRIAILGSTGSIGTQALEVVAAQPEKFKVTALVTFQNDRLLEEQIERFKPDIASIIDEKAAMRLKSRYSGSVKVLTGEEGLLTAATYTDVDIVLTAMVGFAGLKPTLAAIEAGKDIALANKETMVAAGALVTSLAKQKGVSIFPVDSEHSAIFQCMNGEKPAQVKKIILTASGGPFLGWNRQQLKNVTVEDCLRHPNWTMGRKITVDSATLVNKGLEVIEAKWLFGINYEQIEVVVHPQSIIHSMVEFADSAVMAQMGMPDMRLPIQYAFSYPERLNSFFPALDFSQLKSLTFTKPDLATFPSLNYAYQAGNNGGTMPCVFNAANEVAVNAFLDKKISFLDIFAIIEQTMNCHHLIQSPTLKELEDADNWARIKAADLLNQR